MVIGTSNGLRALGQSLIAAAEHPPEPLAKDWPPQVSEAAIVGAKSSCSRFISKIMAHPHQRAISPEHAWASRVAL